jgi:hypothetical protein
MNFSFGIITNGQNDSFIKIIIDSIIINKIPNYEIIIVGNTKIENSANINILYFDEKIKEGWITKKKNIIIEKAIYENVVIIHDYVSFDKDWYVGFLKFGNNFKLCITKIKNIDNTRYRDYTLFPYKVDYLNINYSPCDIDKYFNNNCLLPYSFKNSINTNKYLYISGAYFVVKKYIGLMFPLDETLLHNGGEDVEWSKRLHNNNIIIECNSYSSVSLLKYKIPMSWEKVIDEDNMSKLINFCNK